MNIKTGLLITLSLAILISFLGYAFYSNFEYKEVTERTGLRSEASTNPLYASRLFLKRMGIPSHSKSSVRNMGGFPDTDTVLIIVSSRSSFTEKRTNELLDWVKSGGHLIARSVEGWNYAKKRRFNKTTPQNNTSRDPLQQQLGISTGEFIGFNPNADNDTDEDEDEDAFDESMFGRFVNFFKTSAEDRATHKIHLKGVNESLEIQTNGFKPLQVNQQHAAQSELIKIKNETFIIRQTLGKGLVTLVSDLRFIKNYHLEKSDHAKFFWHLVHGLHPSLEQPSKVWLIHNDEIPSILALLWHNAWALLLSLTLIFLSWILMVSQRFGPLIPKQQEDRRSLKEHISNSGHYYWKNNKKHRLIQSTRDALSDRQSQVHPGWAQQTKEQQIRLLADQISLPFESIEHLLYAKNIEQADEFTALIKQLENIRKSL